jgi:hypothetical protein
MAVQEVKGGSGPSVASVSSAYVDASPGGDASAAVTVTHDASCEGPGVSGDEGEDRGADPLQPASNEKPAKAPRIRMSMTVALPTCGPGDGGVRAQFGAAAEVPK